MLLIKVDIPAKDVIKNIDFLHKKYGRILQLKDSYERYHHLLKMTNRVSGVTYGDYALVLEDYYTFYYSSKMKSSSWRVFTMIRQMTRLTGAVCLSYKMYCDYVEACGDKPLSKPTYYASLKELIGLELIVSMQTIDVYKDVNKIMESTATYGVKDKSKYIYKICDYITRYNCTPIEAFFGCNKEMESNGKTPENEIVSDAYVNRLKDSRTNNKKKLTESKLKLYLRTNLKVHDDLYHKFVAFISKYNKSGSIALTRRMEMAKKFFEYSELSHDEMEDAINKTIKNTGRNNKSWAREKYLYKILDSYYDVETAVVDEAIEEIVSSAESKLEEKFKSKGSKEPTSSKPITEDEYQMYAKTLKTGRHSDCKAIFKKFENSKGDREKHLIKNIETIYAIREIIECDVLHDDKDGGVRRKLLREKGIAEYLIRNEKYNFVVFWRNINSKDEKYYTLKQINDMTKCKKIVLDEAHVKVASSFEELEEYKKRGYIYM